MVTGMPSFLFSPKCKFTVLYSLRDPLQILIHVLNYLKRMKGTGNPFVIVLKNETNFGGNRMKLLRIRLY